MQYSRDSTGTMMENKRSVVCALELEENNLKRRKSDLSFSSKERKDKLGERISALQQLVSPYGKTDTASVLLEAMQYIQFLQEQVKVLSAPYLQTTPTITQVSRIIDSFYSEIEIANFKICDLDSTTQSLCNQEELEEYSLGSRGLCLVPLEYTLGMAQTNGADIWAPVKTPTSPAFDLKSNSPFR